MTIFGGVGAALAFSAASGGKVYAYNNVGTGAASVAPINPSRTQITFHNPGTVDIFVAPANALNVSGVQSVLSPTTGALGGCFRVFANGGTLVVTGECQGAWQAFSASAANNALTVMDSNV